MLSLGEQLELLVHIELDLSAQPPLVAMDIKGTRSGSHLQLSTRISRRISTFAYIHFVHLFLHSHRCQTTSRFSLLDFS
jgi:hypothetical protein